MLPYLRLVTLYQQAVFCEKSRIPGSFVECGVWKGGAMAVMASANLRHGRKRRDLHLFDVFDDIGEPDAAIDGERALQDVRDLAGKGAGTAGRLEPIKGMYDPMGGHGTLDDNRHVLEQVAGYDPAFLHYHEGWFQETVPPLPAGWARWPSSGSTATGTPRSRCALSPCTITWFPGVSSWLTTTGSTRAAPGRSTNFWKGGA